MPKKGSATSVVPKFGRVQNGGATSVVHFNPLFPPWAAEWMGRAADAADMNRKWLPLLKLDYIIRISAQIS